MTKVIELDKAIVEKLDNNIIQLTFKDGVEFELADAFQVDKAFESLSESKPYLSLVDASNVFGSISKEARDHFAKPNEINSRRIAEALVANNIALQLIARFYINFHKPNNPVKVFTDINKAKEWLLRIL